MLAEFLHGLHEWEYGYDISRNTGESRSREQYEASRKNAGLQSLGFRVRTTHHVLGAPTD